MAAMLCNMPRLEELLLCNINVLEERLPVRMHLGDLLQILSLQTLNITDNSQIKLLQQDIARMLT